MLPLNSKLHKFTLQRQAHILTKSILQIHVTAPSCATDFTNLLTNLHFHVTAPSCAPIKFTISQTHVTTASSHFNKSMVQKSLVSLSGVYVWCPCLVSLFGVSVCCPCLACLDKNNHKETRIEKA